MISSGVQIASLSESPALRRLPLEKAQGKANAGKTLPDRS
jgi:hypothetical protein